MPVYMIRAGENGPVKIGHSHDPEMRLGQLQISHWEKLRIIRLFEGRDAEEASLHARFSDLYIRGEWHHFSRAMLGDVGLIEIIAPAPIPRAAMLSPTVGRSKALANWIADEQITLSEAGRRFGVAHTTVARWCTGKLFPGREYLAVIRDITGGKVTPDDFVFSAAAEAAA